MYDHGLTDLLSCMYLCMYTYLQEVGIPKETTYHDHEMDQVRDGGGGGMGH